MIKTQAGRRGTVTTIGLCVAVCSALACAGARSGGTDASMKPEGRSVSDAGMTDAGTGDGGAGTDASVVLGPGIGPACSSRSDCTPTPATPDCEPTIGHCVAFCSTTMTCTIAGTLCDTASGYCVPTCVTGADCAGAPGTPDCDTVTHYCVGLCPAGYIACDDICVVENATNCGTCGNVCPPSVSCVGGVCDCPDAGTACGDVCVDLATDLQHCGMCSIACTATDEICSGGSCICPNSETVCGSVCVNTQTDPDHCGSCGHGCDAGVCFNGQCGCSADAGLTQCADTCVDTRTNLDNCGTCNHVCTSSGTLCISGGCCTAVCVGRGTCLDTCGQASCASECPSGAVCQGDGGCACTLGCDGEGTCINGCGQVDHAQCDQVCGPGGCNAGGGCNP